MKSTINQLNARGFVSEDDLIQCNDIPDNAIPVLLNSPVPYERTFGAIASSVRGNIEFLPLLCAVLETESKLYTKIALSEAIVSYGEASLEYLVPLLGKIGNNQHKKAALVDLNKKSFPLPRDLAARIIIRIGEPALPCLEEVLFSGAYFQKAEAVDAIGHIAFNYMNFRSELCLMNLLNTVESDELLQWKIIRAFQSFKSKEVEDYLKAVKEKSTNKVLKAEAARSLLQIARRRS